MTKGAISKIVSHLQDRELVERAPVTADRRAQRVVLTAAGSALVPKLAALAMRTTKPSSDTCRTASATN